VVPDRGAGVIVCTRVTSATNIVDAGSEAVGAGADDESASAGYWHSAINSSVPNPNRRIMTRYMEAFYRGSILVSRRRGAARSSGMRAVYLT
jgi:hypothetical protein